MFEGVFSMTTDQRSRRVFSAIAALAAGCIWATSAPAAIIDIYASVSTTVQELIDGSPGSVSSDDDELNLDSSNLPLLAFSDLMSTDLEGALVSMAQGFSEFTDPTISNQPNPEEFALEVAAYSNEDAIGYSATGSATESRTIIFTTEGSSIAPPEIDFNILNTQTVESRIFLSGAVLLWSTAPGASFDQTQAEFDVTVTRDDTAAILFQTTVTIVGGADGDTDVTTDGPIQFEQLTLDDLAAEGVDAETLAILQSVDQDGTLVILVVPPQEHAYRYTVRADESLVLTAELEARIRTGPGGTGVAAAFGAPFANLADFIEEGLPGVDGSVVQRSLNTATSARDIGLVTGADAADQTPIGRLCGVFGIEWAAMALIGVFMRFGRSRR